MYTGLPYKEQIVELILNGKVLISVLTKQTLQPPNEFSICWKQRCLLWILLFVSLIPHQRQTT